MENNSIRIVFLAPIRLKSVSFGISPLSAAHGIYPNREMKDAPIRGRNQEDRFDVLLPPPPSSSLLPTW